MFRRNKNQTVQVPDLTHTQWAARAIPSRNAVPGDSSFMAQVKRTKRENAAYLNQKLANQAGVVIGFHGTSTKAAQAILSEGFENRIDEEGFDAGVSTWDEVASAEAMGYARDRARQAGEDGDGVVLRVRMQQPQADNGGRLAWRSDANETTVLEAYTTSEFQQQLRVLGNMALASEIERPRVS